MKKGVHIYILYIFMYIVFTSVPALSTFAGYRSSTLPCEQKLQSRCKNIVFQIVYSLYGESEVCVRVSVFVCVCTRCVCSFVMELCSLLDAATHAATIFAMCLLF